MPRGENLGPWKRKPGDPGIPGAGRPKKAHEERDLERLRRVYTEEREKKAWEAMVARAEKGDPLAVEWLDKRLYGGLPEKREIDQTVTNRRVRVVLLKDGEQVEELPSDPLPVAADGDRAH